MIVNLHVTKRFILHRDCSVSITFHVGDNPMHLCADEKLALEKDLAIARAAYNELATGMDLEMTKIKVSHKDIAFWRFWRGVGCLLGELQWQWKYISQDWQQHMNILLC